MYHWTDDRIRWMEDASAYCGYHRALADIICEDTDTGQKNLADCGCGIGQMSLLLAGRFRSVTAIDTDAEVLSVLRKNDLQNKILIKEGRAETVLTEQPFDLLLFNFFGNPALFSAVAPAQKNAEAVWVTPGASLSGPGSGHAPHPLPYHWDAAVDSFLRQNIPFRERSLTLEFGQPFRTEADALHYFETHSLLPVPKADAERRLSALRRTDREPFRYYLPFQKPIRIFRFSVCSFLSKAVST